MTPVVKLLDEKLADAAGPAANGRTALVRGLNRVVYPVNSLPQSANARQHFKSDLGVLRERLGRAARGPNTGMPSPQQHGRGLCRGRRHPDQEIGLWDKPAKLLDLFSLGFRAGVDEQVVG